MAKISKRDNWRVEVYPNGPVAYDMDSCHDIAKQIRRHCDDVGIISVQSDLLETCEYCGYKWGTESSTYNGGCCDKDEANNPEFLTEAA